VGAYSWYELVFFLLVYSFLGWACEVAYYAITQRRFCNRGFTSLPFMPFYGITYVLLILVLPTVGNRPVFRFLLTMVVAAVVERLADHLTGRIVAKMRLEPERNRLFSGTGKGLLFSALIAGGYYLIYQIFHPMLLAFTTLVPALLLQIVDIVFGVLIGLDFVAIFYATRTGDASWYNRRQEDGQQAKFASRLTETIWKRLGRAYPGIRDMSAQEQEKSYTFAKGVCLDKLIWVFLVSALLGDIIETFYCGLVNGQWMNRSSVLYGPFSFVWGLGAVVLTVTLQGLAGKNDRHVFLAGFVIGGAYEYMCSVFTELVFGTVFWDYSDMPLNIGGRTNVLFCFFWGVLAVVWIKILYPPMSKGIEKVPPLAGKIVTWVIMFFMICNGLLTSAVMVRYGLRTVQPEPDNVFEEFLDQHYDNGYVENRWPNMIVTGEGGQTAPDAGE